MNSAFNPDLLLFIIGNWNFHFHRPDFKIDGKILTTNKPTQKKVEWKLSFYFISLALPSNLSVESVLQIYVVFFLKIHPLTNTSYCIIIRTYIDGKNSLPLWNRIKYDWKYAKCASEARSTGTIMTMTTTWCRAAAKKGNHFSIKPNYNFVFAKFLTQIQYAGLFFFMLHQHNTYRIDKSNPKNVTSIMCCYVAHFNFVRFSFHVERDDDDDEEEDKNCFIVLKRMTNIENIRKDSIFHFDDVEKRFNE